MKDFKFDVRSTPSGKELTLNFNVYPDGHGNISSESLNQPFADPFQAVQMMADILRMMWKESKK